MIRVADYIATRLAAEGVRHVFLVAGGGAMYLNNAFRQVSSISCVCMHHEQAAAMAAEGYARITNKPGVVNVTSGPGSINALNGVFGAWTDSIPMLVVSGQVKKATCLACHDLPHLRQLGDQEVDIIRMVGGITKYAVLVTDPATIAYHLEKAFFLARSGRPGPCWIDVPVDVQSSMIDPEQLEHFKPESLSLPTTSLPDEVGQVLARLRIAKRPVILAGTGVRLADAVPAFRRVTQQLQIPVTTAWTHDLIPSDDPVFCGRQGTIGDRAGNFCVQNSDLLLVIGSRLNIRQLSYNWSSFAPHAYKMQVDIDPAELRKPTLHVDMPIQADARAFLEELEHQVNRTAYDPSAHEAWLAWCKERQARYPAVLDKHRTCGTPINPYHFIETLSDLLEADDVVVCGDATACIVTFQASRIKEGQRVFSNSGSASMGYDLPAAIGAAFARGGKRIICLAGDGSLQQNLQELQTVVHHRLPIKLFVLNNGGYLSIRMTQQGFFGARIGADPESGVSFPDTVRIAQAYGIAATRLTDLFNDDPLRQILAAPGPAVCDVFLDSQQAFEPRLSSRVLPDGRIVTSPLEDMYPYLDRAELASNMLTSVPKAA